jgi:hypothetical protein
MNDNEFTRRQLAPQAVVWHAWLLTRMDRTVRGRALPRPRVARSGSTPAVTEEVCAPSAALAPVTAIEWQKLWLATQRRPWRSLAVVPVGGSIPTARVARALADVGSGHLGEGVSVTDATRVTLASLQASMEPWTTLRSGVDRVLIALGPLEEHPASLAIAQAADAAILCLTLNESAISEATRAIEEVGRERFLGSVILRSTGREAR